MRAAQQYLRRMAPRLWRTTVRFRRTPRLKAPEVGHIGVRYGRVRSATNPMQVFLVDLEPPNGACVRS